MTISRLRLSDVERREVQELASVCNAFERLELKLAYDWPEPATPDEAAANCFLHYDGEALTSYCSLEYGELCGMVRPDMRRRGIGGALLEAALAEGRRRGMDEVTIICERASRSGQAFVARALGHYTFAEHHMELDATQSTWVAPGSDSRIELSKADEADIEAIARLVFGDEDERGRNRVARDMSDPKQYFLIARLQGTPISTLRIIDMGEKAGIYGFAVLPEHRGKGYGKATLTKAIRHLVAEGQTQAQLEVETDNAVAIGLYEALGFRTTTTYEYYEIRQ